MKHTWLYSLVPIGLLPSDVWLTAARFSLLSWAKIKNDKSTKKQDRWLHLLPGNKIRSVTNTSPSLSPLFVNIDWKPLIELLAVNEDKFCTLAKPIRRFVSESNILSTSSAASI